MNGRKCGTCYHFEPAPIWRKGWCRNPLLYSPQQSHLVSEDVLDCERGMGNYWEPGPDSENRSIRSRQVFQEPVAEAFSSVQREGNPSVPISPNRRHLLYPVSGSSGYSGDPPPPSGSDNGGPIWSGDDHDFDYYQEERYWTDYVRIAAPIIGVIIMVGLLYFWISSFLDDDGNGTAASGTPTTLATLQTTTTASPTASPASGTPPPVGTGTIVIVTSPPTETSGGGGEIYEGAPVVVANTGGTGVNIRTEPNVDAEIITVALDGTLMTTIGPSVASNDFIWWPVESEDFGTGWVVQDYIELAE